jgi:hypothetical protein
MRLIVRTSAHAGQSGGGASNRSSAGGPESAGPPISDVPGSSRQAGVSATISHHAASRDSRLALLLASLGILCWSRAWSLGLWGSLKGLRNRVQADSTWRRFQRRLLFLHSHGERQRLLRESPGVWLIRWFSDLAQDLRLLASRYAAR